MFFYFCFISHDNAKYPDINEVVNPIIYDKGEIVKVVFVINSCCSSINVPPNIVGIIK